MAKRRLEMAVKEVRRSLVRKVLDYRMRDLVAGGASTMVIAPHPDDETFACGGLLALKRELGAAIRVAILSAGEGSHRNCCATPADQIGRERLRLAGRAVRLLGLEERELSCLGLVDGRIPGSSDPGFGTATASLTALMEENQPTEIYAPAPFDCWPDHERAAALATAAVRRYCRGKLYYYPVWMWHNLRLRDLGRLARFDVLGLDIGPVLHRKKEAVQACMDQINPWCGNSLCGRLPAGFAGYFTQAREVYFQVSGSRDHDRLAF